MVAQHHAFRRTFTENPNKPHVCQDVACSPRICLMRQMGGGNSADLLILSVFCSSCPQLSPSSTRLGCREQVSPYPRTSLLGQPQGWTGLGLSGAAAARGLTYPIAQPVLAWFWNEALLRNAPAFVETQQYFVHHVQVGKQVLPCRLLGTQQYCVINTHLSFLQLRLTSWKPQKSPVSSLLHKHC